MNPLDWFRKPDPVQAELQQLQLEEISRLRTRLGDIEASGSQYEAANHLPEIWGNAQITDADAALRAPVREALRKHYRYERANNPVVNRITNVYVDDLMGETGPLLKLRSGNRVVDALIQKRWSDWWRWGGFANKLSVLAQAVNGDGEGLTVKSDDQSLLRRVPISLSLKLLECDRLTTPYGESLRSDFIDGIHLDRNGNPSAYDLRKAHPGTQATDTISQAFEIKRYSAQNVFHIFRQLRPEQHRGVTAWHSSLPTIGKQRDFLSVTLDAAAIAARLSVLLKTNLEAAKATKSITLPGGAGTMLTLPKEWEAAQMKAEHPTTTLEMFFKVTTSTGAGCFSMPVDRALGWAINGTYPAIRALLLPYAKRIQSDRSLVWEPLFFDPLYEAFLDELLLSDPQLRGVEVFNLDLFNTTWKWAKPDLVVDPSRDATANTKRIASGETTREDLTGVRDIDEHDEKSAEQLGFVNENGEPDRVRYRRWLSRNVGNKILDATDEDLESIDGTPTGVDVIEETFNLVETN